ncbi:hypothetical protein [Opitutus sp. GAS368]|uniref:hypothetical protein n=1 Tax=Opitutus sp. GAS368 TaxID=1882749 RepID=UPI000879370B|nr:hypothetical protein [Opitutus sp. GAS368]SDS05747.1 hypothetical protein SAMN05444173_1759 [Opitutus sp. GAS368]
MIFSNRNTRHSLLIEINPYQILAAAIDRPDDGPTVIESTAEFDADDDAGLRQWLDVNFDKAKSWVPVIGGFVPPEALLQRESIQARRLSEAGYLTELVKEQYKVENPAGWKFAPLSPLEGAQVPAEGMARPALICGVSNTDVHQVQQRMLDHRLLPYRLEMSLLPLLGAIMDHKTRNNDKRAAVVVVIEQEHTTAYILGKEGVHTPGPVRHGFSSIAQAACKEFGLKEAAEVRERLQHADDELLLRASKFVRAIGRDLKPLVDSYEMTTGQPVGEIYCAYLPASLSWIAEPLAQVVGRTPFTIDCPVWLPTVNIQLGEGVTAPGQHWLGALSLVAELPGPKPAKDPKDNDVYQGPWHLDCRLSGNLPSNDLVRSRFMANAVAATLAVCALMILFWQLYLNRSLQTEISFWNQRISENQKQANELKVLTRTLGDQTAKLDQAYTLTAAPYVLSDLVMAVGRTRLERMSLESINGFTGGVVLRGTLRAASSEQATQQLRAYVETLRHEREFAALFGTIALTSLERIDGDQGMHFEVALKLKEAKP